jgi:hypothetical protein
MVYNKNKKDYYINCLKNALLINALINHNSKDINEMIDYNFKEYDGSKLPHLSGCDYSNICFSYIQPDFIQVIMNFQIKNGPKRRSHL